MTAYHLLLHRDYERTSEHLPPLVRSKARWAQVQLGARGSTPTVKGTIGLNAAWRRSPVQGSHYYLWWIPAGEAGFASEPAPAILVHSIRHHDETDRPIEVGLLADYVVEELALADPRFDDQTAVSDSTQAARVAFSVVEGLPGSGKSVALAFLARDLATNPGVNKIRYITYTERLKRAAREIFDALGPDISRHVTAHTVNDVVKSLIKSDLVSTPYAELRDFVRDLETIPPKDLGAWRGYPLTLYTELRAHVVGRSFPPGYQLPKHRAEQLRRQGGSVDVERYARQRRLDMQAAGQAVALAERLGKRYFLDQRLAAQALAKLNGGEFSAWLSHSDAFIVDEVQDLTLLQIALLGEMARLRLEHHPDRPFSVTIAGDESQIVQPTGFKWGVTKDLIADRLDAGTGETVRPRDFHFDEQRRSPPLIDGLIRASWNLYGRVRKDLRPSAAQSVRAEPAAPVDEAEQGLVLLAPPPALDGGPEAWAALLQELGDRPGRALIDLTEHVLENGAAGDGTLSEVIFPAREIKGLERSTILVHGLGALYARIVELTEDDDGDPIPHMEARRLIDQMRVALSRSTSRLALLEPVESPVFTALGFDPAQDAVSMSLPDLVEFLRGEDMTEAEMVYGLLGEAEDLLERARVSEAIQRNERARAIAARMASPDLLHQAEAQRARLLLEESEVRLAEGAVPLAQAAFATLAGLRAHLDGELYGERLHALEERLAAASNSEFDRLTLRAERALDQGEYEAAARYAARARDLAQRIDVAGQAARADALLLSARRQWAAALAAQGSSSLSPQIAELLRAAAGQPAAAEQALRLLARRYEDVPARQGLSHEQMQLVIGFAATVLRAANGLAAEEFTHLHAWLDETFAELDNRVSLFHEWAAAALALAEQEDYSPLDEALWDLENRLALLNAHDPAADRFRAFLSDYGGDPTAASLQWERLGDTERAIASARQAGDLERAYRLIQANRSTQMPEALSTAVKALRQLQQLGQKQQSLTPAERRALLEELARLHAILSAADDEG